jgi:hypothetical protein
VSPFLDSPTIRPLYDVHDGGPPLGFRCQLFLGGKATKQPGDNGDGWDCRSGSWPCKRVTRTLRGMVQHQRMVHGIKQQQEFNFEALEQGQQN